MLGILPPLGSGLRQLALAGQLSRFLGSYVPVYLEYFARVELFSYLDERLEDYTEDPELRARVRLHGWKGDAPATVRALALPFLRRGVFRRCGVLRVLQVTGALPAIVAKRVYGIPYVTTYGFRYAHFARTLTGSRLRAGVLQALEWSSLRFADRVVVTTDSLARYVGRRVPPDRIILIPNGVDPDRFRPSAKPHQRGPQARIVFVGRLVRQKNLLTLLEALTIVARDHPVRLVLIGDGPLREILESRARRASFPVDFLGVVPHHLLPKHLVSADVFVLPSLIEGHPKALLEAMACAVPCVAADVEGCREVVVPEETGLLFDPRDVSDLARQITRVLDDEALAIRLGERARASVVDRFALPRLLRLETGLLHALATGRHRG